MVNRIFNNRFKVLSKIGSGGMSVVYKCFDIILNRMVAIKILKEDLLDIEKETFIKRFKLEALSLAALQHQYIVPIYDVGVETGIHYIIMEYIDGCSLKEIIEDRNFLEYNEAVKLFIKVCSAFKFTHNNNIIHRDIKPHNILITKNGIPKIVDFGVAKILTESAIFQTVITQSGNVVGSIYYFSPEQAKGIKVDARSDIYSLGVTFYEVLTGTLPFKGRSPYTIINKHLEEKPINPSLINRKIPKDLSKIVLKMLEKRPDRRHQCMEKLVTDLEMFIEKDFQRNIFEESGTEFKNNYYPKYENSHGSKLTKAIFEPENKGHGFICNKAGDSKKIISQLDITCKIDNNNNKSDNFGGKILYLTNGVRNIFFLCLFIVASAFLIKYTLLSNYTMNFAKKNHLTKKNVDKVNDFHYGDAVDMNKSSNKSNDDTKTENFKGEHNESIDQTAKSKTDVKELTNNSLKLGSNEINNNGAEILNSEWKKTTTKNSAGMMHFSGSPRSGKFSFYLDKFNIDGEHTFTNSLSLKRGSTYLAELYCLIGDLELKNDSASTQKHGAIFGVTYYQDGKIVTSSSVNIREKNTDWTKLGFEFSIPLKAKSNQVTVRIGLSNAIGEVSFDDISIREFF